MSQPAIQRRLKARLDHLYAQARKNRDHFDPITRVRAYQDPEDREVAGLIAAVLAYGRIAQILSSIDTVLCRLSGHPAATLAGSRLSDLEGMLSGFRHRFTDHESMALVLFALGRVLDAGTSLQALFHEGYSASGRQVREALTLFVQRLRDEAENGLAADRRKRRAQNRTRNHGTDLAKARLRHLLSSPLDGSACKRLNLFLRWMVRPDDGIDLGLWSGVNTAHLVVPLDTHTARVGARLGLLKRKSVDWRAAEELTECLKRLDPEDPVKYDFALSHLGSEGPCRKQINSQECRDCDLGACCEQGTRGGIQRRNRRTHR